MERLPFFLAIITYLMVYLYDSTDNTDIEKPSIPEKPNILFIMIDDFRPEIGSYGKKEVLTPYLDEFAKSSLQFNESYCNYPVCGASRASILSGLRPTSNRFTSFKTLMEEDAPEQKPIFELLKNHGYTSISHGKILHHQKDSKDKWSEKPWRPKKPNWKDYILPENQAIYNKNGNHMGPSTETVECHDTSYYDGRLRVKAIETLQRLKNEANPFFYCLGFVKPHLPFTAPKKYWDLYNQNNISAAINPTAPEDAPSASLHNFSELRKYTDIPDKGPLSVELKKKLKHGYYACVSYIDTQVGLVLEELKRLKLDKNTIVIITSDHGWHLGEQGLWCKHSLYENSMRVPFYIRIPGVTTPGSKSNQMIEFVDIYPTLAQLAHCNKQIKTDGQSILPLIKNPLLPGKQKTIGRFQNGITVKTKNYRYSWFKNKDNKVIGEMYYDHTTDSLETANIISKIPLKQEFKNWQLQYE